MTEAIYRETADWRRSLEKAGRRMSVSGVLGILGFSRSGYRAWLRHIPSKSETRRREVKGEIRKIYDESGQNYGAPKISVILRRRGRRISERTVGKYMRSMDMRAQWMRPWTATTRDSCFSSRLSNVLDRQFNPPAPNACWCTDITYVWTAAGFVYLTSIMDLFSRKIVSWTLSRTLEARHVVDTVLKAQMRRDVTSPLVIHSDRGCQYVSEAYRKATERMRRSYSAKGCPWDNACIESFHSLIKREWLNRFRIVDFRQAYSLVFEYVETFYNTRRIHGHCDFVSPDDYEKNHIRKKKSMNEAAI